MANEATTVEVVAATAAVEKQPHRLERKWSFWIANKSRGGAWDSSLRKVYTFETVEEFWCLYDEIFKTSMLPGSGDLHLFKAGIEPKWEDPECADGGKWTVSDIPKGNGDLERMWVETLMALIGEQFDEAEADDICGVVASVRHSQDRLALWTKKATNNKAAQIGIGRKWKEIIDVDHYTPIIYSFHADSTRATFQSGFRYSV